MHSITVNHSVKTRRLNGQKALFRSWGVVCWYAGEMWRHFWDHNCLSAAGALTYTTLFAVVPLMTVTYTFFSLIPEYPPNPMMLRLPGGCARTIAGP